MQLIDINGTRLNVRVERISPSAPWIVFSNSLLTDLRVFDAQVEAAKPHFNIIRYDQRGHGLSTLSEVVDFKLLGQDVLALLDTYDVDRCIYVGLSMGVPTGLSAYQQDPDKFSAMVLMDGQAASAAAACEQWQDRINIAREKGLNIFSAATADRWLSTGDSELKKRLSTMMSATPLEGFCAGATALKSYDFESVLPTLTIPMLLMAGANDGAMPKRMKAISETLTNSRFVEIANAGHVPCFEQAHDVNTALLEFLQEVSVS